MVSAQDNSPCFNPTVTISDVNFTNIAPQLRRTCASRTLYFVQRSWAATDLAGLSATASQMIAVVDDQVPVATAATTVTLSRLAFARSRQRAVVRLGITPALPNKRYQWRLVAPQGGPIRIKQGKH
jgi:hypothetical protein